MLTDAPIWRYPNIALNVLCGHLGGCGERFSRCFSLRGVSLHLSRTLSGPIARLAAEAATNHSRDLLSQLVGHFQRSETRHRAWRVEVPRILRKPDEIPDLGIGGPRATKRRTGQFGRHTGREKGSDIALGGGRFDRREVFVVQTRPRGTGARRCALVLRRFGPRLHGRLPPPRRAQWKTSLLRPLPPPHACAATSAR